MSWNHKFGQRFFRGFPQVFLPFLSKKFWKGQENFWAWKPLKNSWKTIDQICGFMTYGLSGVFLPPKMARKPAIKRDKKTFAKSFLALFSKSFKKGQENLRARKPLKNPCDEIAPSTFCPPPVVARGYKERIAPNPTRRCYFSPKSTLQTLTLFLSDISFSGDIFVGRIAKQTLLLCGSKL